MAGATPLPIPSPTRSAFYSALVVATLIIKWSIHTYKLLPTVLVLSIVMQVGAFVSIPSFVFLMRWRNSRARERGETTTDFGPPGIPSKWGPITFALVCIAWYVGTEYIDELEIWKYAAGVQVFAYAILVLKVAVTQNVAGISAGKLVLDILALGLRLLAMSWSGFRMPRQANNDFTKAAEAITLCLAAVLLGAVRLPFRKSYRPELDTFSIGVPVLACLGLAVVLHADVGNVGHLPNMIWTASMYLDAVAMFPQLHLIAQSGGAVDQAAGHHMALVFTSRLLGGMFWWLIKGHWFLGLSYTGWGIMAAYYVQLLVLCNFFCFYVKALFASGAFTPIVCYDLPLATEGGPPAHEHDS